MVVGMGASGAVIGDQTWFLSGHFYGERLLKRFPKLARHAKKIEPMIQSKADWIAITSRFVYGTRTISPVLLGSHGYSGGRFIMINVCTASLWALIGASIGYLAGKSAKQLLGETAQVEKILLVTLVILMLLWWYRHRKISKG